MNLQTLVLGSGAGGGVPQWNCACKNCENKTVPVRTQSSIAVSKNNFDTCVLINASPDFSTQVRFNHKYLSARGLRTSPITDVILTDSHIDHITGLLSMREAKNIRIHCTEQVKHDIISSFNIVNVLSNYTTVDITTIKLWKPFEINDILFLGFPIKGKAPPYNNRRQAKTYKNQPGDTIALVVNEKLLYAPAIEVLDTEILNIMDDMDTILVDGTCWNENDMISQGLGKKQSKDMGHIVMSESLPILKNIKAKNKYFIHINNSNPVLQNDHWLTKTGWELSYDGLYID
jgi:pyrroloquinoline quinone biosynthesis protein B